MNHIHLERVDSTNNYLKALIENNDALEEWTYVTAYEQTIGRGQRGNSWESEAGKNLSLSLLIRPRVLNEYTPFDLNIVTSLSLIDLLCPKINGLKIKWPNDLLVGNKKIAGILTENEWMGNQWAYSIVGIGLNVYQTKYREYIPQATSLSLETLTQQPLDYPSWHHPLAKELVLLIRQRMDQLYSSPLELRKEYLSHLYRYQESALYATPDGKEFQGMIVGVEPSGILQIKSNECTRRFAFKEVIFR